MAPAARDRALRKEMRLDGNLHPALCSPGGHYAVLSKLSAGLVKVAMPASATSRQGCVAVLALAQSLCISWFLACRLKLCEPSRCPKAARTVCEHT